MASTNGTAVAVDNMQWNDPNVKWAIIISIGAGLSTGIGGALVFVPELLKKVNQATILAVSLALSAGVMLYVSFIEIFAKSYESIVETGGVTDGGAAALTTLCFFLGMGFCVLLELLVQRMSGSSGGEDHACAAHAMPSGGFDDKPEKAEAEIEMGEKKNDAASVKVDIVSDTTGNGDGGNGAGAKGALPAVDLVGDPEEAASLSRMGLMTALAIAIHNFPEGLATFLACLGDVRLGASLGVAIAVHNIPEGCATVRACAT